MLQLTVKSAPKASSHRSSSQSSSSTTTATPRDRDGSSYANEDGHLPSAEDWLEKYRPKTLKDMKIHHTKVKALKNWFTMLLQSENSPSTGNTSNNSNSGARIFVLFGGSGTGKRTFVQLMAQDINFAQQKQYTSSTNNHNSHKYSSLKLEFIDLTDQNLFSNINQINNSSSNNNNSNSYNNSYNNMFHTNNGYGNNYGSSSNSDYLNYHTSSAVQKELFATHTTHSSLAEEVTLRARYPSLLTTNTSMNTNNTVYNNKSNNRNNRSNNNAKSPKVTNRSIASNSSSNSHFVTVAVLCETSHTITDTPARHRLFSSLIQQHVPIVLLISGHYTREDNFSVQSHFIPSAYRTPYVPKNAPNSFSQHNTEYNEGYNSNPYVQQQHVVVFWPGLTEKKILLCLQRIRDAEHFPYNPQTTNISTNNSSHGNEYHCLNFSDNLLTQGIALPAAGDLRQSVTHLHFLLFAYCRLKHTIKNNYNSNNSTNNSATRNTIKNNINNSDKNSNNNTIKNNSATNVELVDLISSDSNSYNSTNSSNSSDEEFDLLGDHKTQNRQKRLKRQRTIERTKKHKTSHNHANNNHTNPTNDNNHPDKPDICGYKPLTFTQMLQKCQVVCRDTLTSHIAMITQILHQKLDARGFLRVEDADEMNNRENEDNHENYMCITHTKDKDKDDDNNSDNKNKNHNNYKLFDVEGFLDRSTADGDTVSTLLHLNMIGNITQHLALARVGHTLLAAAAEPLDNNYHENNCKNDYNANKNTNIDSNIVDEMDAISFMYDRLSDCDLWLSCRYDPAALIDRPDSSSTSTSAYQTSTSTSTSTTFPETHSVDLLCRSVAVSKGVSVRECVTQARHTMQRSHSQDNHFTNDSNNNHDIKGYYENQEFLTSNKNNINSSYHDNHMSNNVRSTTMQRSYSNSSCNYYNSSSYAGVATRATYTFRAMRHQQNLKRLQIVRFRNDTFMRHEMYLAHGASQRVLAEDNIVVSDHSDSTKNGTNTTVNYTNNSNKNNGSSNISTAINASHSSSRTTSHDGDNNSSIISSSSGSSMLVLASVGDWVTLILPAYHSSQQRLQLAPPLVLNPSDNNSTTFNSNIGISTDDVDDIAVFEEEVED